MKKIFECMRARSEAKGAYREQRVSIYNSFQVIELSNVNLFSAGHSDHRTAGLGNARYELRKSQITPVESQLSKNASSS